jgi:hypothetical protein
MLTEMNGKGGTLCSSARTGTIRCPLIVRPNSEDVITGHLFQSLGYINPRWWLPDLLNSALGTNRFRRQFYRGLKIQLWVNQPCYPRELLPWDEGSTQVDTMITFENPPTTIFIEAKYGSALSTSVSGDDGSSGYPSDQLIRNIRVGLHHSGFFSKNDSLFDQPPRDFVVLVLSPTKGHPLVDRYRDSDQVLAAIPHSDRLIGLPRGPFVGQLDYNDIITILTHQSKWMTVAERRVVQDLTSYLDFKRANVPTRLNSTTNRTQSSASFSGFQEVAGSQTSVPENPLEILSVG